MRIKKISALNVVPVKKFEVDNLSDLVVIAGQNGVGKSRLIRQLINAFRNPNVKNINFIIEPTNSTERAHFNKGAAEFTGEGKAINTALHNDAILLLTLLQQNKRRRNYSSGVLYYESDRSIVNVSALKFQFEFPDPWEEQIGWDVSLGGLKSRWADTQHSIFKKIHQQSSSIASRARQLRKDGHESMNLGFEDPLTPFMEAFLKLLGPKKLIRADLQKQQLIYDDGNGLELPINSLSSGEREVLNITFDFILRKPSHCIVFFDEPELHLHPELLGRLISTLRSVGENNQFILISHSPEVISSSLDDTVIFLTSANEKEENQAIVVGKDDGATEVLNRLGQSVGVVALGKKIVLIEGNDASLDKATYTSILQNRFPNLVLLPSGGKGNLRSFDLIQETVLNNSIWGVDFYMLADRDAAPNLNADNSKFRTLPRYHLENYFLDSAVLAASFSEMEPNDSWLRSSEKIEQRLRELAKKALPYASSLIVNEKFRQEAGNVTLMPKGADKFDKTELTDAIKGVAQSELARINIALNLDKIYAETEKTYDDLNQLLEADTNEWKFEFPAKSIFSRFCHAANIKEGRLKALYLARAEHEVSHPMQDVIDIFENFST